MAQKLRKLGELVGYHLHAIDGDIGELINVYYDDQHWTVRYFIVHTGNWLNGNDVLIAPSAVTGVDDENNCLNVSLTREQVENSPPIDTEKPVSRYYEEEYHRYYNWEPYWVTDPLFWSSSTAAILEENKEHKPMEHPNLRSVAEPFSSWMMAVSLRICRGVVGSFVAWAAVGMGKTSSRLQTSPIAQTSRRYVLVFAILTDCELLLIRLITIEY